MVSDEILIIEFQRGSRSAFEELYTRHSPALFGFFRRRVQSPQKAEDLTQETFLAIIHGIARYEPRALVRTYIYSIAFKILLSDRRTHRNETELADPDSETAPDHPPDNAIWLKQAIQRLDPCDREVLMLREYEQLSYTEIAELLHLPLNTVRTRLFRARMALRSQLDPVAAAATPKPVQNIEAQK
jgi:RNA polymerase sigma-70 factor (ECF subfamily)